MDDLISKSKLIEEILEEANTKILGLESGISLGEMKEWVENQTPIEKPTWIPCSERLPEENRDGWTELLLSIKKGEVILGFWHDIETGFCRRFRDGVCSAGGVIAWMPLPEPYKGE